MRLFPLVIFSLFITACSDNSGGGLDTALDDNDPAPKLSDQTLANLSFGAQVAGTIAYSDSDSPAESITITVESAPSFGTVSILNHGTGAFQYEPTSVAAISGDSFTVSISDGELNSAIKTITLSFSDASAPVVSLSPNDEANNVFSGIQLSITSDDSIDESSISYISENGSCSGSVQLSLDNFASCLAISSVTLSQLNRVLTVTPAETLSDLTTYQFKVTTGLKNAFNLTLSANVEHSFTTARAQLLITEVSSAYYANGLHWFELYNLSAEAVDLAGYQFRSRYYDASDNFSYASHQFSLPSVTVEPGQYVVVRAQDQTEIYGSNERVVHVKDGTKFPFWTDAGGYIDLLKDGKTIDFVTFGSTNTPTTSGQWTGGHITGMSWGDDTYAEGIARSADFTDTNTAADWAVREWSTPGGANDVTCNTDTDSDGIPDCSEQEGTTFAGLPLYDWGARVGQRDIFIEVDYMESNDAGIAPNRLALEKVVAAFDAQNIAVHFDVGDLFDNAEGTDPQDFDLGGGNSVPFSNGVGFDPADNRANLYDYKRDYMNYARIQIFHYLLMANSQNADGSGGSSGLAEFQGNDFLVSLGNWGLSTNNASNTQVLVNYQAATIMHELGHNLGLRHGGNEETNHKPNYISIMNYLYQLAGLPEIGNDEGDRLYYDDVYHDRDATCYNGLTNNPSESTFKIDFSHGEAMDINKSSVNETLGLGRVGSDAVDFNCNGNRTETSVNMGSGTWKDYDDWGNLILLFQKTFSGSAQGDSLARSSFNVNATDSELNLMPDNVGDDRHEVIKEYAPSAEFFRLLKQRMAQSSNPQSPDNNAQVK